MNFKNDSAFDCFYDTPVKITGVRTFGVKINTTCRASVLPFHRDEAFSESSAAESKKELVSVTIPSRGVGGWNRKDPPQIGDKLTIESKVFTVTTVRDMLGDSYGMEGRSNG